MAIFFEKMLIEPAKKAGISVPENLNDYIKNDYPHWFVYCTVQLGSSLPYSTAHWDNAKIIANISNNDIKLITLEDLLDLGFSIGNSYDPPNI